jgi:6-phosphofructokinase 1
MKIRRIAVTTGGGDAPGLNAVLRAVTLASEKRGWECVGIRCGYDGILFPDKFPLGGTIQLNRETVRGIAHTGGTILGTTNRGNPFAYQLCRPDGSNETLDVSQRLVEQFHNLQLDALVAIGGDGSMRIAAQAAEMGIRVVGVPKTIDNDLPGTIATFGFDTAVDFATEAIDRLHSTAAAHQRVMIVEVMGRDAGWIALHSGVAGSADVILIPEIPFDVDRVANKVHQRNAEHRNFTIIVVAEGAKPRGGEALYLEAEGRKKLGGIGEWLSGQLRTRVENEVRCVVLGHLLRGGSPTSRDRLLSLRFGAAAVRALESGQFNVMVALDPPEVKYIPLSECTKSIKTVPLDNDTILTARDLGTCFGD